MWGKGGFVRDLYEMNNKGVKFGTCIRNIDAEVFVCCT